MAIVEKVRKRDGVRTYYIDFRDQTGDRVREVAGTSRRQAKNLLTRRLGEVRAGTYVNPRKLQKDRGPTFNQFVERFLREHPGEKRSDHYPKALKRIVPYFNGVRMQEITRADLDRFRARLLSESVKRLDGPLSSTSVLKLLRTIHRVFRMAVRWGVIEVNPAAEMLMPSPRQHKTRFMTIEEFRAVEGAAPDWLRPMLKMAVATGMRLKEVVSLRWDDVNRAAGVIHVPEKTKTGSRDIPMSEAAQEVLAGQVRHLTSPMVFVRPDGTDYMSDAARTRLSQVTTKVMRDAGVANASFHTLRHTAAAWMVQAGVSLYDVQNILGHSTPMMTMRYAHLQPDHLRRAVTALDQKLNSWKVRSASRKTGE